MKIVVLVLRGCSAGSLGCYGNEWVVTPDLDRLAAEGVVFDRHYSDCPAAAAARTAWRTGRDAFRTHAMAAPDLLQQLRESGILTAVVRANRESNDAHPDYYAAWGKVFDARPLPGEQTLELVERLPTILTELAGRDDWFLQIEIDTLLPPWVVPPGVFDAYLDDLRDEEEPADEPVTPWATPEVGWFDAEDFASWELLRHSFAAVVTGLDADLGKVFDLLRPLDAAIIVTSDGGFPLGEHGVVGPHRPWLHEELVHLPLILRLPGGANAGHRVGGFTQPADLMPTVLSLFGLPTPDAIDGRDVSKLETHREQAVTALTLDGAAEAAIRTDAWACLIPTAQHPDDADDPRAAKLYVKPDDHWEVNDLAAREPDIVAEFERRLTAPR
jgi:arylsulfatase A-like enzyme